MGVEKEIKDAMKEGRLVMGSNSVIRGIKLGKIETVIYASNIPENKKRDLSYYSNISAFNMKMFSGNSAELGELCGKPFSILMVGIAKK